MCAAASQVSTVQGSPSSQPASVSQQPGIASKRHPVTGSHASTVHGSPSVQASGVPGAQRPVPVLHVSTPLQTLPSSQAALLVQQFAVGVCTQPDPATQLSVVQATPSSQSSGTPT